jgi:hypothetical protein
MENWSIAGPQLPQRSQANFNQDIVVQFKAGECGAAVVINPCYVVSGRDNEYFPTISI